MNPPGSRPGIRERGNGADDGAEENPADHTNHVHAPPGESMCNSNGPQREKSGR